MQYINTYMIIVWLCLVLNGAFPVNHVIQAVTKIILVRLSVMIVSLVAIVTFAEQQIVLDASQDISVGMPVCMFVLTLSTIISPGIACTHCSNLITVYSKKNCGIWRMAFNLPKFFTNCFR